MGLGGALGLTHVPPIANWKVGDHDLEEKGTGAGFGLLPIALRGENSLLRASGAWFPDRLPVERAPSPALHRGGMEEPLSAPSPCFDLPVAFAHRLCCRLAAQKVVKLLWLGQTPPRRGKSFKPLPLQKQILPGMSRRHLRSQPAFETASA